MIKKNYSNIDVLKAAKKRIKNVFATANAVELSVSGGKDSICLSDLIFKMCQSGEIDKSKLVVDFIDEEAIYPCVDEITRKIRFQWLSIGVEFRWWCIQVRHFNCLNALTQDESFICWDETKKDVWIRERPKFAITSHPLLKEREDTYQSFLEKLNSDRVSLIGVRAAESVQRLYKLANVKAQDKMFPIYDWTDSDVWRYIRDNNLAIPDAYIYMYQVGISRRQLRISQFFSVDTVGSLVQMCEYYPDLFERICRREPNAYMAMLYFDTELFRHSKRGKKSEEENSTDWKAKALDLINQKDRFVTNQQQKVLKEYKNFIMVHSKILEAKQWKEIYCALVAGDPKNRSYRALHTHVFQKLAELNKKGDYFDAK